jgi:hypothetical protein
MKVYLILSILPILAVPRSANVYYVSNCTGLSVRAIWTIQVPLWYSKFAVNAAVLMQLHSPACHRPSQVCRPGVDFEQCLGVAAGLLRSVVTAVVRRY